MTQMTAAPPDYAQIEALSANPRRGMWVIWLLVGFVAVLGVGGVLYVSVQILGSVAGEEFSPYTMESREFEYTEIPLMKIQISPISRNNYRNALEDHIFTKYMPKNSRQSSRWDLVMDNRTPVNTQALKASILDNYLSSYSLETGDLIWLTWSEEHPDSAKILWPRIVRLAQLEQYDVMPQLFRAALDSTEADKLERTVSRICLKQLVPIAEEQASAGEIESASELGQFLSDLPADDADGLKELQQRAADLVQEETTAGEPAETK